MNILVIGNGGREHTMAWKIKQSPLCHNLFIAPGNAGTSSLGENIPLAPTDFNGIREFCMHHEINLLVVGPEGPLVEGLRDYLEKEPALKDLSIIGPGKQGAKLEGSKDFSKHFMQRHGIPTAKARTFEAFEFDEALKYLSQCKAPIVLKADGLAAGKGVVICISQTEAKEAIREMLIYKKFGEASSKVLVEEFLSGVELSVFVLTDGTHYITLPEAKDYKRIQDQDKGPNTGGMGAVSPVPFAQGEFLEKVDKQIIQPTIAGLQSDQIPYIGFIFFGLMNVGGNPYLIEYNVRMGDPETQAVLPRIESDLVELLMATASGNLKGKQIKINSTAAVTIVKVSKGYPGEYEKGKAISGITTPKTGTLIFHAGTKTENQTTITDGGRVLAVTGMASSIQQARENAYDQLKEIQWDGAHFRNDIGLDVMK